MVRVGDVRSQGLIPDLLVASQDPAAEAICTEAGVTQELSDELEVPVLERITHPVDLLLDLAVGFQQVDAANQILVVRVGTVA